MGAHDERGGKAGRIPWTISNAAYLEWHGHASAIEDVGGWRAVSSSTLADGGEPRPIQIAGVTPSLFGVLRAQPALGRLLIESDATSAPPQVIVLSHGLWLRAFGGRADIIGHVVRVGDRSTTIVGVMPRGFAFPDRTEAWVRLAMGGTITVQQRRFLSYHAIGRRASGVSSPKPNAVATKVPTKLASRVGQ